MKQIFINFIIIIGLLFFSLQTANAQNNKQYNKWTKGQIFVKVNDNIEINYNSDGSFNLENLFLNKNFINDFQITKVKFPFAKTKSETLKRTVKIYFDNNEAIDEMIKNLNGNASVEYAEKVPNFVLLSTPPNDPYYNQTVTGAGSIYIDMMDFPWELGPYNFGEANTSWHLNLINAEAAWELQTGDPNIIVADLDNGIWTAHPDLANVVVYQYDIANEDDDPTPGEQTFTWSHGTHTAGLIAAENNNEIGIASIGNGISLMAIKIQDDNSEDMSSGIEAIAYAADNGAKIISMSWGGEAEAEDDMQVFENVVNYAWNAGCLLLASAGNNGDGSMSMIGMTTNSLMYPAAFENVIAVGSCDANDKKSSFSQYGTWVDILSPGGSANEGYDIGAEYGQSNLAIGQFNVLSTTYSVASDISMSLLDMSQEGGGASYYGISGNYDIMPGTSMSCPIAAGLCGLIWSANPSLTNEQVRYILESTCDNVDVLNPNFIDSIGHGRINALAAIQAAQAFNSFSVSGTVTDGTNPLADVTITYNGGTTTTNAEGEYTFFASEGSNQNITASKLGYTFEPENITLTNIVADTTNNNFVGTAIPTYTVSGRVTFENTGLADVTITYNEATTTTNANGDYTIIVTEGDNLTITASKEGYTITPENITLTNIVEDKTNQDFVAEIISNITENDFSRIAVYPNPTKNIITIANCNNANYEIYNILGRKIKEGKLTNDKFEINLENLNAGQYLLKINNNKDLRNIKILKLD